MTRLNVVLLLAVLASALYLVSVQYESRRLFAELDRTAFEARRIEAEREQLELAQRAQATPLRIERQAKDQLHMRAATPAITHYVSYTAHPLNTPARSAEPPATGGSPQAQGVVR